MSDHFLRLIPTDPGYMPPAEAHAPMLALLQQCCPRAHRIEIRTTEEVNFIDAGGNTEGFFCSACGADLGAWWGGAMDQSWATSHFADLTVEPPCCGLSTSLNDIRYEWPAGFARFVLEAMNPDVREISSDSIAALEGLAGCRLRVIRTHY